MRAGIKAAWAPEHFEALQKVADGARRYRRQRPRQRNATYAVLPHFVLITYQAEACTHAAYMQFQAALYAQINLCARSAAMLNIVGIVEAR